MFSISMLLFNIPLLPSPPVMTMAVVGSVVLEESRKKMSAGYVLLVIHKYVFMISDLFLLWQKFKGRRIILKSKKSVCLVFLPASDLSVFLQSGLCSVDFN